MRQLFICAVLLAGQAAWAEAAVTLEAAQQAAARNIEVSLAQRAVAAAQGDVAAADHAPAPVLSAKASQIDLQNGVGGGNAFTQKRIDKSLGIDWTWERGNKRELRTRAAQRTAEAAQADLEEARVLQRIAASAAFFDLLAAQEREEQVEAVSRSAAQLAGTAARRVRAGDLPAQEALRTEIEAQRAQQDLQSAQLERKRAALALAQLTSLGPAETLVARTDWPATPVQPADAGQAPVQERGDVRAARQRLLAAQAALESANALRKADITLGSSIDHFPGTSSRQLEFRVQVPLQGMLGGYAQQGEIARAQALLDQAQDTLDKTLRTAAGDAERLRHEMAAATARAQRYRSEILPRAQQVAAMGELAYSRGAMSLTDLIDARRTLRTVLVEDIAARADQARALTTWALRAQPQPLPESIGKTP